MNRLLLSLVGALSLTGCKKCDDVTDSAKWHQYFIECVQASKATDGDIISHCAYTTHWQATTETCHD